MKNESRARRSRTAKNIAPVAETVEENPRSLKLGIPQTSLHRILHKGLDLKAYKVQLTQELKHYHCICSLYNALTHCF